MITLEQLAAIFWRYVVLACYVAAAVIFATFAIRDLGDSPSFWTPLLAIGWVVSLYCAVHELVELRGAISGNKE
jgi:hypothetical protein